MCKFIEKALYVFWWTKRRKRGRESRQTIWVLFIYDALGIRASNIPLIESCMHSLLRSLVPVYIVKLCKFLVDLVYAN